MPSLKEMRRMLRHKRIAPTETSSQGNVTFDLSNIWTTKKDKVSKRIDAYFYSIMGDDDDNVSVTAVWSSKRSDTVVYFAIPHWQVDDYEEAMRGITVDKTTDEESLNDVYDLAARIIKERSRYLFAAMRSGKKVKYSHGASVTFEFLTKVLRKGCILPQQLLGVGK